MNIAVVDDEKVICEHIREMIEKQKPGCDVACFSSGEDLKKCSGNSAKAKELEDFLKKIPELEKQGYEQLSAQNKALGGTVTYYK